jgi:hypothetical protein
VASSIAKEVREVDVESRSGNGKQAVSKGADITMLLGNYQLQRCCAAPFGQPAILILKARKPS